MLSPQIAFDDLPGTIRAAWHAATDARDPFGDGTATGYAAPTRTMVLEAALGFFHWLARAHGLTDGPSPGALVTRARVAAWLAGRPDLAPASAYTHANALKLFVQASYPQADTRPLRLLANAYRRGIPRSDAWKLGLPDRDQVIDHGLAMVAAGTAEPAPPVDDARRARDGLVIALMGWTPKRTADVGRLTLGDHLRTFGGEARVVVQPQKTAPHAGARAVPLPPEIQAALTAYLAHAWPVLTGQPAPALPAHEDKQHRHAAAEASAWGAPLWPSRPVIGDATGAGMTPVGLSHRIAAVTARDLGQKLWPSTFRHLVATHLGRWQPAREIAVRLDHVSAGRTAREVYRAPNRAAALERFALFG